MSWEKVLEKEYQEKLESLLKLMEVYTASSLPIKASNVSSPVRRSQKRRAA